MLQGGVQKQGPTEPFPRRKGLNGIQKGELISQNAAWAKVGMLEGRCQGDLVVWRGKQAMDSTLGQQSERLSRNGCMCWAVG